MLIANLPALQVVIPLVSAPVCLLLRNPRHAWACALLVSWLVLAMALLLVQQVSLTGTISYPIGAWATPWGIEYRVDMAAALMILMIASIGAVVMPYAWRSILHELPTKHASIFYTCYLLCLTGLLGIVVTGDTFNLFVFLEISSLSSYVLISLGGSRRALTAAFQYLVMGTIGATFILIGIGLLYMMTGTLNMQDIARRLPVISGNHTVVTAFAFLTVGISIKLALVPLHLWLPNAYAYAPSVVTAFIAATSTKIAFYVLLRFMYTLFGASFAFQNMPLSIIFLALALAAMFAGSVAAIFQDNVKRLLAYSSVAQIGYMILGISFASATGLTAAILHLFNHALMKGALFLALGCVYYRFGSVNMEQMRGLGRSMPWTMAAFVIGGLSLIGVPLTVGFISKWYLVVAALELGWWPIAAAILLASLLAVVYIWRIVEAAYFQAPADSSNAVPREAPLSMLLPTWALIIANLYFGIDSSLTTTAAAQAAQCLLAMCMLPQ